MITQRDKRDGEPAGTRTQGPRLKRAMLYRLSYRLTCEDVNRESSFVKRLTSRGLAAS